MATIDKLITEMALHSQPFIDGMQKAIETMERFERRANRMEAAGQTLSAKLLSIGAAGKLLGRALASGALGFISAETLIAGSEAAQRFDRELRGIRQTIGSGKEFKALREAIVDASGEFGTALGDQAQAAETLLKQTRDVGETMRLIDDANRLATGSSNEVTVAAKALTTIMGAYGERAGTAADITDQLAVALRDGSAELPALTAALGEIAGLSATAGVRLEELLAAFTLISRRGGDAGVTIRAIHNIIKEVINPSTEAAKMAKQLGFDFSLTAIQSKGLAQFLTELNTVVNSSTQGFGLFLGNAKQIEGALQLAADGGREFNAELERMVNRGGVAAAAAAVVDATPEQAFEELRAKFRNTFDDVAQVSNKILGAVARFLADHFEDIADAISSVAKAITIAAGAWALYRAAVLLALAPQFITILVTMVAQLVALTRTLGLATVASNLLAAGIRGIWLALGPIGVAIGLVTLLAGAFFLSAKRAREAKEAAEEAAEAAREALTLEKVPALRQKETAGFQERHRLNEQIAQQEKRIADAEQRIRNARAGADRESAQAAARGERLRLAGLIKERERVESDLKDVQAEIERRRKIEEQSKIDKPAPPPVVPDDDGKDAIDRLGERVEAVVQRIELLRDRQGDVLAPLEQAAELHRGIEQLIEQQGGALTADIRLLEQARDLTDARKDAMEEILNLTFLPKAPTAPEAGLPELSELDGVREAIEDIENARARLQIATLAGDQDAVGAATLRLDESMRRLAGTEAAFARAIEASNLPIEAQKILLEELRAILQKLGISIENVGEDEAGLVDGLRALAVGVRGALQLADAFGTVDESVRKVIDGIAQTVDGIAAMRSATTVLSQVSAAIGIAGGIASVLSTAFGPSQREVERDAAVDRNSDALEELSANLQNFAQSVAGSERARVALGRVLSTEIGDQLSRRAQFAGRGLFGEVGSRALIDFDQQLRLAGTSMNELAAEANRLGIEIFNSTGGLIREGLVQLQEALRLAAIDAVTFSQSVADQAAVLDARVDIFELDTSPLAELQRQTDFLAENLGTAVGSLFDGIDVSTEVGRQAAEDALRRVFEMAEAGDFAFNPDMIGQFETIEQLVDHLLSADNALDDFRETVEEVNTAFRNLPAGFKVARAVFEATAAIPAGPLSGVAGATITEPAGTAAIETLAAALGRQAIPETLTVHDEDTSAAIRDLIETLATAPQIIAGTTEVNITIERIDARDRSIKEILDELTEEARSEAQKTTGNTAYPYTKIA